MNSSQFQDLIERYISDQCSAEEIKTLGRLLEDPAYMSRLEEIMEQQLQNSTVTVNDYPEVVNRVKNAIGQRLAAENQPAPVRSLPVMRRWAVAAAILLIAGAAAWLLISQQNSKPSNPPLSSNNIKHDIDPGKEGAILTLENGQKIILDSLGNGFITDQNGTKVLLNNGQLAYNAANADAATVAYNTMTTPKGRQFRLLLQDGTMVWLNAASSLRYPTVFTGKERSVEITGEAYFEVAKNAQMPFHVKINNETEIEVLGTHFNVNSYTDEASVNTTLLQGSVKVLHNGEQAIIKPGQQAQVTMQSGNKIKVLNDVNVEKIMAWKNGIFNFQDATLHEVMRQLERWYDIEVVYEKGVPEAEFVGKMGRDLTLSEVLHGLEISEVHFKVQDRKLIVTQ